MNGALKILLTVTLCFLRHIYILHTNLFQTHYLLADERSFQKSILLMFFLYIYFRVFFDNFFTYKQTSRYMKKIIIYLNDQSQVESLRDQKSNDQACFLFGMSRQIEYKNGQVENSYTRNNQVDNVEKRLSPDNHVEIDIRIRLRAARIVLLIGLMLKRFSLWLKSPKIGVK